jgi:hypothetical protein
MERSAIRESHGAEKALPDFASLYPGYKCCASALANQRSDV